MRRAEREANAGRRRCRGCNQMLPLGEFPEDPAWKRTCAACLGAIRFEAIRRAREFEAWMVGEG